MYTHYSLLIVDDEEMIRENLSDEMKEICGNIHTACNGLEALEILKSKRIDVAFVDARMPQMNGVQFLQHARETSPDTVCIVVSGSLEREVLKNCFLAGAYDFVEKPYESHFLKQIALRAFEKSFFQCERRSLLEFMVCTYTKTKAQDFRKLSPHAQSELMKFALGVFRMNLANTDGQQK